MLSLLESLKDVEATIEYLSSLVSDLKKRGVLIKYPSASEYIYKVFTKDIGDFQEQYLLGKDKMSNQEEEVLLNSLLDLISSLKDLE